MSECRRIPIEELDGQTRPSVCEFASSPRMVSALAELLKAYKYAGSTTCCRWEFAVEISRLRDAGISESDFRWLVRRGYVEHAREVTRLGEDGRRFRPTGDLSFAKRTCFILTATGAGIADELVQGPLLGNSEQASDIASNHVYSSGSSSKPAWDFEKRTLYFRNQIVKRFKWHAANQEIVLSTFQEENWPVRIDDQPRTNAALMARITLCSVLAL